MNEKKEVEEWVDETVQKILKKLTEIYHEKTEGDEDVCLGFVIYYTE